MAFAFVMVLATLAAYTGAVPRYNSGVVSPLVGSTFGRDLGHNHFDSGFVTGHGSVYDASRLVQDAIYNPRRRSGFLNGGGFVGTAGLNSAGGRFLCPKCEVGETCLETPRGQPYCAPINGGAGIRGSRLRNTGFGGVRSQCMYLDYPNNCLRTPGRNTMTRYAFSNGVCQRFTSSRISQFCRPQQDLNNVFRTRFECEQRCMP